MTVPGGVQTGAQWLQLLARPLETWTSFEVAIWAATGPEELGAGRPDLAAIFERSAISGVYLCDLTAELLDQLCITDRADRDLLSKVCVHPGRRSGALSRAADLHTEWCHLGGLAQPSGTISAALL